MKLTLDNIETVIKKGDYDWPNIIRLTIFTTDFDKLFQSYNLLTDRLLNTNPKPIINLIGVARLVVPELMIEIDGTPHIL